jgi:hypothetical protein
MTHPLRLLAAVWIVAGLPAGARAAGASAGENEEHFIFASSSA